MWLDRFSQQPTPSATPPPGGRSYSPAPGRRPYLPPRPGINPRSSSLSLISPASSTTSLPLGSRAPNGYGVRSQINGTSQSAAPNPLHVLERIFGGPPQNAKARGEGRADGIEKPEVLLDDIDFTGLSLQAYVEGSEEDTNGGSVLITAHSANECEWPLSTYTKILLTVY